MGIILPPRKLCDWIWANGDFVAWENANIHVTSHTLHYGLGAIEGIRCYCTEDGQSAIFRLQDHVRRLFESMKILGHPIEEYTEVQIGEAIIETIKRNNLNECYIRPLVVKAPGPLGVWMPGALLQIFILVWDMKDYLGKDALKQGIRAEISAYRRPCVYNKAKAISNYTIAQIAKQTSAYKGFHEVLMLDHNGNVAEASGANIFLVRERKLFTPNENILEGITRQSIISLAQFLQIEIVSGNITIEDVFRADEMFLCGTAVEVTPIVKVDTTAIGEGVPGEMTKSLQGHFLAIVRGNAWWQERGLFPGWLTYITSS
jgi:branched-chain amino acid aminotransferase